jgi:hypothetical protein
MSPYVVLLTPALHLYTMVVIRPGTGAGSCGSAPQAAVCENPDQLPLLYTHLKSAHRDKVNMTTLNNLHYY